MVANVGLDGRKATVVGLVRWFWRNASVVEPCEAWGPTCSWRSSVARPVVCRVCPGSSPLADALLILVADVIRGGSFLRDFISSWPFKMALAVVVFGFGMIAGGVVVSSTGEDGEARRLQRELAQAKESLEFGETMWAWRSEYIFQLESRLAHYEPGFGPADASVGSVD